MKKKINNKIKIYLIARISKDAHDWNNKITKALKKSAFEVFKPHEHNPWNKKHTKLHQKVVDVDVEAIKNSHFGLALPEFGRDCAWECGYYANCDKPAVIFVDHQTEWLRDWMIKGMIDYVITNNRETYTLLKKDSILKNKKIFLIKEMKDLNKLFIKIYKKYYGKNKKIYS